MTHLAITGASGFLGLHLVMEAVRQPGVRAHALSRRQRVVAPALSWQSVDLRDRGRLVTLMEELRPQVVVHLAAETRVDWCESNPLETIALNVDGTRNMVEAASRVGARVIFMSTDSVFNGREGRYRETDQPGPLNTYAESKLRAEQIVLQGDPRNLVLRANFFGLSATPGHGLAEWVLQETRSDRAVVGFQNVVFTPLLASTLAKLLLTLAREDLGGLFHAGCSEPVSKYQFACEIAASDGKGPERVTPGSLASDGLPAPRPLNTSLDSTKLCSKTAWKSPSFKAQVHLFKEEADKDYRGQLARLVA